MITAFKNVSAAAANRVGINDSPCPPVGRTRSYGLKPQREGDLGLVLRHLVAEAPRGLPGRPKGQVMGAAVGDGCGEPRGAG